MTSLYLMKVFRPSMKQRRTILLASHEPRPVGVENHGSSVCICRSVSSERLAFAPGCRPIGSTSVSDTCRYAVRHAPC